MELFKDGITAPDQAYNNIRDGDHPMDIFAKELANNLWQRYEPFADDHFLDQFQRDFYARFWEMDLTCCLLDFNFSIDSVNHGPDIKITNNDTPIWVEAIAPNNGKEGLPDSVPELTLGVASSVPDEQIILRLTSAIDEKYKKYNQYIKDGIVLENEPYIIAINGGQIRHATSDFNPPRIVRAVFPIGNEYIQLDRATMKPVGGGFHYKEAVTKANGTDIPIDIFLNPEFKGISAIIYSNSDCCNRPETTGLDYVTVHNPMARNPIEPGTFPIGTEYIPNYLSEEEYELQKVVHQSA